MVRTTLLIAGLLTLLGVIFYFLSRLPHTLAPLTLGVLLAICAAIVVARPALRKQVMHVAMLLALLGILGMIMPLTIALKPGQTPLMLIEIVATMTLCAIYLALGIRSFITARRSGGDQASSPSA